MPQNIPKRNDFIRILTRKGFTSKPRKGDHLGLYLMDEDGRKTGVSTGVCLGGRNTDLIGVWNKLARELCMSSSDLSDYNACKKNQAWLLNKLRSESRIRQRGQ